MSWVTVIWSITSGICLILAAVHFLVWLRKRDTCISLAFAIWVSTTGITALFELALMQAQLHQKIVIPMMRTVSFAFESYSLLN